MSLDFERTMNRINFDRIVRSKPETFFYVTLPEKEEEKVPEKGKQQSRKGYISSLETFLSKMV